MDTAVKRILYAIVGIILLYLVGFILLMRGHPAYDRDGRPVFKQSSILAPSVRVNGDLSVYGAGVSVWNYIYYPFEEIR